MIHLWREATRTVRVVRGIRRRLPPVGSRTDVTVRARSLSRHGAWLRTGADADALDLADLVRTTVVRTIGTGSTPDRPSDSAHEIVHSEAIVIVVSPTKSRNVKPRGPCARRRSPTPGRGARADAALRLRRSAPRRPARRSDPVRTGRPSQAGRSRRHRPPAVTGTSRGGRRSASSRCAGRGGVRRVRSDSLRGARGA